jgi:hypothetical protein
VFVLGGDTVPLKIFGALIGQVSGWRRWHYLSQKLTAMEGEAKKWFCRDSGELG